MFNFFYTIFTFHGQVYNNRAKLIKNLIIKYI